MGPARICRHARSSILGRQSGSFRACRFCAGCIPTLRPAWTHRSTTSACGLISACWLSRHRQDHFMDGWRLPPSSAQRSCASMRSRQQSCDAAWRNLRSDRSGTSSPTRWQQQCSGYGRPDLDSRSATADGGCGRHVTQATPIRVPSGSVKWPAAAVVFGSEVRKRTEVDRRLIDLNSRMAQGDEGETRLRGGVRTAPVGRAGRDAG
jgi:hypothetical protein